MDDSQVHGTIEQLVAEEHELWEREAAGNATESDRQRLSKVKISLTASTTKPLAVSSVLNTTCLFTGLLTGATGLEPATSGVTGRRSNQLNYAPVVAEV